MIDRRAERILDGCALKGERFALADARDCLPGSLHPRHEQSLIPEGRHVESVEDRGNSRLDETRAAEGEADVSPEAFRLESGLELNDHPVVSNRKYFIPPTSRNTRCRALTRRRSTCSQTEHRATWPGPSMYKWASAKGRIAPQLPHWPRAAVMSTAKIRLNSPAAALPSR
jgi:hypothetical protein